MVIDSGLKFVQNDLFIPGAEGFGENPLPDYEEERKEDDILHERGAASETPGEPTDGGCQRRRPAREPKSPPH